MTISVFDLFSIGIGPSSSHTVGPMRAMYHFLDTADQEGILHQANQARVELFGSLALTGKGHGTDIAIVMGMLGETPDQIDPQSVPMKMQQVRDKQQVSLLGQHSVDFTPEENIVFYYDEVLPKHANGMRFQLLADNAVLFEHEYYSIGGGFFLSAKEFDQNIIVTHDGPQQPYPYKTAEELLGHCQAQKMSIAEIVRANERTWHSDAEIDAGILNIWRVMHECIEQGMHHSGVLPGGLKVKRRAAELYQKLQSQEASGKLPDEMNWINLYALAVNEENAAGGRVVTAPTNGAAGIIPAVLQYYKTFESGTEAGIIDFMLTATAIGILYKEGASISAAEVGCQGEVGVACSMAAAGLCAAWGGSVDQVENAAEIGMEHHLGLTCDPVGGLVQIPCIERNAMGAVQAINTAKLALMGDGIHHVSLDTVIKTMRETGADMQSRYKETSQGGLAVNLPAC